MTVVKAIHDLLAATPGLTGYLSSYMGSPAIFTRYPIPDDAKPPYAIINAPATVENSGTFADPVSITDEQRDIELIAAATGSVIEIDAAGAALADALSNVLLDVPGRRRARSSVINGPRDFPADSDSYGRLVSINVHLVT